MYAALLFVLVFIIIFVVIYLGLVLLSFLPVWLVVTVAAAWLAYGVARWKEDQR